ncbi:hypothetical protein ACHAXA_009476 [Cyclostephanos tholiformis]|uniref:N-acetyltransferase domain-containing protein n=1 Tax=Cyclostephanos tholiformis TaxID=382380 RepID=A0ABD3R345_9STRA
MLPRRSRHILPLAHLFALLLALVSLFVLPEPSSSLSVTRDAVSATTSTSTSTTRGPDDVAVRIASVPIDLPLIRDCRRSAYAGKSVNLPAARSFCEADQITREGYVCVVAAESRSGGRVLGTADLNTKTGVVNNVYVRDEARKRGIARSMMMALEDYYVGMMNDGNDGNGRRRRKLALTVMSKNLPAVNLYKGLGYKAPGVYGGLDAISTMSPLNFLIEMEKEI